MMEGGAFWLSVFCRQCRGTEKGLPCKAGFCIAPLMWEHVEGGLSVICISSSLLAGHGRAKCAPPQGVPWGELEVNSGFCILFCFF